ncbi:MAG: PAS domain S-box protein [Balneolales bacterium]
MSNRTHHFGDARANQDKWHYRYIVEGLNDPIFILDSECQISYANKACLAVLGYGPDELLGHSFNKFLHKEEAVEIGKNLAGLTQGTGHELHIEHRLLTGNGNWEVFETCGKSLSGQADQPLGMLHLRNITKQKQTGVDLKTQARLLELLMDISTTYINIPLDKLDSSLKKSLEVLGKYIGADRFYIFEYDFKQNISRNTYEWCSDGIEPEIENLQSIPLTEITDWVECHQRGDIMHIPDVFELPIENGVRQILEPQEIKSMIAVPMMDEKQCLGFVGLDSVRVQHCYSNAEKKLLTVFANMLVSIHNRFFTLEALYMQNDKFKQIAWMQSHLVRAPLARMMGLCSLLERGKYSEVSKPEILEGINRSANELDQIIRNISKKTDILNGHDKYI